MKLDGDLFNSGKLAGKQTVRSVQRTFTTRPAPFREQMSADGMDGY